MIKRIVFSIIFSIFTINLAFASVPYGPTYGFCADPDLGPCRTKEQVRQKVTYPWVLNRTDGLIKGLLINGHITRSQAGFLYQYKVEIANQLYNNYMTGNITDSRSPYGTVWAAISSGSTWSYDRKWVGEDPLEYWLNRVVININNDKLILFIGLIKECGNEGALGFNAIIIKKEKPPIDVPEEAPPEHVKERPLFSASRMAEGSTNSFTTFSNFGLIVQPNQTMNLKNDNSSRSNSISSADADAYSYSNAVNNIEMIQQMLNQIMINNQLQGIFNNI